MLLIAPIRIRQPLLIMGMKRALSQHSSLLMQQYLITIPLILSQVSFFSRNLWKMKHLLTLNSKKMKEHIFEVAIGGENVMDVPEAEKKTRFRKFMSEKKGF